MVGTPETEKQPLPPQEGVVKEIPETPEIPQYLEKGGVSVTPTQFTTKVTDDSGKPLVQAPATQVVTITIPTTQQQLDDWSKGSPDDSLTWFAMFWLRMIKKAFYFGWRVVTKGLQAGN